MTERLDPRGGRFAATVTTVVLAVVLVFAVLAAIGYLSDATALGIVATAFALAAAFLNAAFGFCLGCEMYGLLGRVRAAR
ncbi:DUF4395 family protein [Actinomycetospora callitridis]|uniref:DUF4395 family protein n=1 Tax=Actinomycetospora callitridis TaxID=913944 RepID=UPI002366265B|nr:DUF4395 family protein [Actinomycetospora callitridis]MDD7920839.1 DUF4395 family protein [Actinomycetospora callitridis]